MAGTHNARQFIADAKLAQDRRDARVEGIAGTVSPRLQTLAEHHAQAAHCARDRCGSTCRATTHHNYVGIDVSIVHARSARRSNTVVPTTKALACSSMST